MSESLFDARLACSIVDRTMQIINCNVNVMGANGRIIGSGDPARVGEMHEGALLALTQQRVVTIDDAAMHSLHGVKPGINLPLKLNNQIVGVIGLTGDPQGLMQFGELVRMTAEMMLEQARLLQLLAHNSRLREELVLSLIRNSGNAATASEWAQRLNVDLQQPRVAMVVELESGQLGVTSAMSELQQLQSLLLESGQDDLMAIVSLTEMVVLRPAHLHAERWEPKEHKQRMERLYQRLQQGSSLKVRLALGNFFPGAGGVERSYRTAKAAMKVGKQRMPEVHCYDYQDSKLPVLLDSLADGWQAAELVSPLKRLKAMDENGVYRKTLRAWFRHDLHASTTAKALYIHKNTLDYRLKRIADLTGLNLSKLDDRFLLYVADQLDND